MFEGPPLPVPRLNADRPALPGVLKVRPEDFRVDEIPEREPDGHGGHLWLRVEKRGLSTERALRSLGKALDVHPRGVGYAGLKDARAVTTQWMSFEGARAEQLETLELRDLRVLEFARDERKLHLGELKGNRFDIVVRGVDAERVAEAEQIVARLESVGVPNFFGDQRFGRRGDTAQIGHALLRGDAERVLELIAASPGPHDSGAVLQARQLAAGGEWRKAARAFPGSYSETAALCRAMSRSNGDAQAALQRLSQRTAKLYVSACQSELFNAVVVQRLPSLGRPLVGDWMHEHASGESFEAHDLDGLMDRLERLEVSPSAPLFGQEVGLSAAQAGEREKELLEAAGLDIEAFTSNDRRRIAPRVSGARRPMRVRATGLDFDQREESDGASWRLRFELPAGSYATVLLAELCQSPHAASDAPGGTG